MLPLLSFRFSFCRRMETAELDSYASRILADLTPFLTSTSEDTLALIVETLTVTVKINLGSWLNSDATRLLTRAILEAWRRNSKGQHSSPPPPRSQR